MTLHKTFEVLSLPNFFYLRLETIDEFDLEIEFELGIAAKVDWLKSSLGDKSRGSGAVNNMSSKVSVV